MSRYLWTTWEQMTYSWPDFFRPWLAPPRWQMPACDVKSRPVDKTLVLNSTPMEWPKELRDLNLGIPIPPMNQVYQGSVPFGGIPVQRVSRTKMTKFRVTNPYGGTDIVSGKKIYGQYEAFLPTPVSGEWANEGYPNPHAQQDRHWVGVEDDGTVWEAIWMGAYDPLGPSVMNYAAWNPDGSPIHLLTPGGSVFKGQDFWNDFRWSAHAINRFDEPHRLGLLIHNMGGGDGTGEPGKWHFPRYGQVMRLSKEKFDELYPKADQEQRVLLESLHLYGAKPYDTGGPWWHCSLAVFAGSQWQGTTLDKLQIPISSLELASN